MQVPSNSAMAFYHGNGLVPAWQQASRFASYTGRIATLPDIIDARLGSEPGTPSWERYFSTTSAEYLGRSRSGNRIIIVAHGVGPMATLDGILKAYSFEFNDKTRGRRGGRISRDEFLKLESGEFGGVEVVDYAAATKWHPYAFYHFMTRAEAYRNPLVRARLGNRWEEYLEKHRQVARNTAFADGRKASADPNIIHMGNASNCPYEFMEVADDQALAHLLSISQLMNMQLGHRDYPNAVPGGSLASEVDCHEWWNGVRLAATSAPGRIAGISHGVDDVAGLLRKNWQKLMKTLSRPYRAGFRMLMKVGEDWFTQYPKKGASMDTFEPECLVRSVEPVGEPVEFKTTIGGYHGIVRYGVNEVEALAPRGANAYETDGEWEIIYEKGDPKYHRVRIQFYCADVDTSRRLTRADELCNDYDRLMQLLGV